jgi:PAS domain S-box-containing protein
MSSNLLLWTKSHVISNYAIALLSIVAALILSQWPALHLGDAPVSLFFCAVMLSAWFGGFRPGFLAAILSTLVFYYYFLPPIHSLAAKPEEIPRLVAFAVSTLVVGTLSAAQRSATESLRSARNELLGTVQELQRANEALQAESRERKDAEEKLRRSEAYLAEGQRLSQTGSWAWDVATKEIVHSSQEHCRIFGFDPEAGPGSVENISQRVHPDDRERIRKTWERAIRDGSDYEIDYRVVLPEGALKQIHTEGHPVFNESGDLIEFIGTSMDVTERNRTEEALRRSETYLAEAQRLTHTGSWACDISTRELIHASEEHSRLYGFDPQTEIPSFEQLVERIHAEDRARVTQAFENASRAGKDFDAHYRIVLPDGTTKYVYGTGHPVFQSSGDVAEFVGIVMDVSERRRADEERERLRQAQAELAHINRVNTMGELTASLAHEVNQPIAAAITDANTCVRWLAADSPNLEEARAAALRVVKGGRRASEIISRIRLLFKKGTSERELLDINEVIREMVVLLLNESARQSVSVRTDLAEDLPPLLGDRVQLQQVLMNLMVNGIDAMKGMNGKRELSVASRRANTEHVVVSVSDTGVGLPSQQADQIFSAFFTTKVHGIGMGLSISRSIVESHGGRLWAAANSPRGAIFFLSLPTKLEA